MKKRYRASFGGRYIIESEAKFDEFQTLDMERMIQEFGNLVLMEIKANPKLLDDMVLPEPRIRVSK